MITLWRVADFLNAYSKTFTSKVNSFWIQQRGKFVATVQKYKDRQIYCIFLHHHYLFPQRLLYIFLYKIFMGITYCRFHCLWHSYSDAADTLENVHHLLHLQTFSAVVDGNKSSTSSIPISKSKSNINNTKYTLDPRRYFSVETRR